jgi:hypothetical protein
MYTIKSIWVITFIYLCSSRYTKPLQCCLYIFLYSRETVLEKYWFQLFLKLLSIIFFSTGNFLYDYMSIFKKPFRYTDGEQSETWRSWLPQVIIFMYMITIFNNHVILFYKNIILLKHKLKPLLKSYVPQNYSCRMHVL